MSDEVFADRFGDISLSGGIVRIDLVSASPSERDEAGQPMPRFRQRVIMPVDGMIRSYEMMGQIIQHLVKTGILIPPGAAPAQEQASVSAPVVSPNFPA